MRKKQILIQGKILTYYQFQEQEGKNKQENTLIFLHGWMQDGKSFEKIFKILEEKNISYISLDLPGFGGSQLVHNDMKIADYGTTVKDFIEKLSLKNPVLLGHSFGGRIAIYLGSSYENIDRIVLLCAAGVQKKIPFTKYTIVKIGKVFLSLPGLRTIGKKVREGFSSPDMKNAGKMTKIFRNTIAQDLQENMKNILIPVLMIWGKDDIQTPVSDAKIIHKHIKDSELIILEGSHFLHQEQADTITQMILDFTHN